MSLYLTQSFKCAFRAQWTGERLFDTYGNTKDYLIGSSPYCTLGQYHIGWVYVWVACGMAILYAFALNARKAIENDNVGYYGAFWSPSAFANFVQAAFFSAALGFVSMAVLAGIIYLLGQAFPETARVVLIGTVVAGVFAAGYRWGNPLVPLREGLTKLGRTLTLEGRFQRRTRELRATEARLAAIRADPVYQKAYAEVDRMTTADKD